MKVNQNPSRVVLGGVFLFQFLDALLKDVDVLLKVFALRKLFEEFFINGKLYLQAPKLGLARHHLLQTLLELVLGERGNDRR